MQIRVFLLSVAFMLVCLATTATGVPEGVIKDTVPPVIHCPSDIRIPCDPNTRNAKVTYQKPTAYDGDRQVPVLLTQGIESGGTFPVGVTLITYMATDLAGNIARCSFNITVTDDVKWRLICPGDYVQEAEKGKCGATVAYPLPVVSNSSYIGVILTKGQRTNTFFNAGATSNTYTATDNNGVKQECSFNVKIEDHEMPVIICPSDTVLRVVQSETGVRYNYSEPTAKDNCGIAEIKLTGGLKSGSVFPIGTNIISYTARDKYENTASCSVKVIVTSKGQTIADLTPPVISCPPDIRVSCDGGAKTAKVTYPMPTATDNGKDIPVKLTAGIESGGNFPTGTTKESFMAQDAAGNIARCSFNIIVVCEEEKWNLSCTQNIIQETEKGKCGANVIYPTPVITGSNTVEPKLIKGQLSNSFFKPGTTVTTYTAIEKGGPKQECTFNIMVIDHEKPVIICPRDTVLWASPVEGGVKYVFADPVAKDNCSISELKQTDGLKSGSIFPVGGNTVTYAAKDQSGNTASCSFTVTVKRKEVRAGPAAVTTEKTQYGDTIRIRSAEVVSDCTVTLFVADDGIEDGDTISIFFNGQEVIQKHRLKINKNNSYTNIIGLSLNLDPTKDNTIVAKAWNVGSIPPNTMEIKVFAGDVLGKLSQLKTQKPLLRRKFECYPGLTDGMSIKCE